jgi:4'-phosphopantetheinyl transferase
VTDSSASRFSVSEPPLGRRSVHLWLCPVDQAQALDSSALDKEELALYARRQGVPGRLLTRHLLSRYGEESPGDWRFTRGRHGKPALAAASRPLEFNLSHSGRWLVLAVSAGIPVGVDVQIMDPERRVDRLARRYFHPEEVADLDTLSAEDYHRRFYQLWSLKEAWTKARGGALPTALGEIAFRRQGEQLVSLAPEKTTCASFWLLGLPGYSLAVCGLQPGLELACQRWEHAALAGCVEPALLASAGGV